MCFGVKISHSLFLVNPSLALTPSLLSSISTESLPTGPSPDKEGRGPWSWQDHHPVLSLIHSVTLGRSHNVSDPQYPL